MTETDQQKQLEKREQDSPLYTDRGMTSIADRVVSQIVDMAVNEVEGIRPGKTNTQVGKYEVAVDFDMEMEFGRDLINLTSALRTRMSEQIWHMTGLRVVEQNIKVTDIFFPKAEQREEDEQESRREVGGTGQETDRDERGAVLDTERDDQERARLEAERDTEQDTGGGTERSTEGYTGEETERELDRESDLDPDRGSDGDSDRGSDREVLLDTERDDEEEVVWDPEKGIEGEEGGEGGDEPRNRNR